MVKASVPDFKDLLTAGIRARQVPESLSWNHCYNPIACPLDSLTGKYCQARHLYFSVALAHRASLLYKVWDPLDQDSNTRFIWINKVVVSTYTDTESSRAEPRPAIVNFDIPQEYRLSTGDNALSSCLARDPDGRPWRRTSS